MVAMDGKAHRTPALRTLLILFIILGMGVYWFIPKTISIEGSRYFNRSDIEASMREAITLLDDNGYAALREMSTQRMQLVLTDAIIQAKNHLAPEFGKQIAYGTPSVVEVVENGMHYAVGEVTVSYEHVDVTYRLTFNSDGKLASLEMR